MKTLIKLAIFALIMNAGYQAIHAYYTYYTFQDELRKEVLNGNYNLSSEMHAHFVVMGKARGLNVNYDNFQMSKEGDLITLEFNYVDNVAFVPRAYSRPWPFEGAVTVHRLKQLKFDEDERQYYRR